MTNSCKAILVFRVPDAIHKADAVPEELDDEKKIKAVRAIKRKRNPSKTAASILPLVLALIR